MCSQLRYSPPTGHPSSSRSQFCWSPLHVRATHHASASLGRNTKKRNAKSDHRMLRGVQRVRHASKETRRGVVREEPRLPRYTENVAVAFEALACDERIDLTGALCRPRMDPEILSGLRKVKAIP